MRSPFITNLDQFNYLFFFFAIALCKSVADPENLLQDKGWSKGADPLMVNLYIFHSPFMIEPKKRPIG